jgi:hypothetical protein
MALGAASWLQAQCYEFTFDSDSSAFEGRFDCRMDLHGWLVGDRDVSRPDGTLTFSQSLGKGTALPAKIGARGTLDLRTEGRSSLAGSFRLEISSSGISVSDFQLDFVQGSFLGLEGSLSMRHRAFVTRFPSAKFDAGSLRLGIDRSPLETWNFAQTGPSQTQARRIGNGRWWVEARIPGSMGLTVPVFGDSPVTIGGLVYSFSGEVEVDLEQATFSGSQAPRLAFNGRVGDELPGIQVPPDAFPGSKAGLLLWFDSGEATATVEGRSRLRATAVAEH